MRVELAEGEPGDGMSSAGLRDLDLGGALDTVGEIGSVVLEKLKAARPGRITVELRLGFAVESGKLTALWVGGRGEASMTVTLEWPGDRHNLADGTNAAAGNARAGGADGAAGDG